jgi:hypothetical protein
MVVKRKKPWEEMRMFDIDSVPETQRVAMEALEKWWMETAAEEAAATISKAVQYGSSSLTMVGEMLHGIAPDLEGVVSEQELAITFYIFGKMARIMAALERGEQPSMEHWEDVGIYTKMIAYVRQNGSWV